MSVSKLFSLLPAFKYEFVRDTSEFKITILFSRKDGDPLVSIRYPQEDSYLLRVQNLQNVFENAWKDMTLNDILQKWDLDETSEITQRHRALKIKESIEQAVAEFAVFQDLKRINQLKPLPPKKKDHLKNSCRCIHLISLYRKAQEMNFFMQMDINKEEPERERLTQIYNDMYSTFVSLQAFEQVDD